MSRSSRVGASYRKRSVWAIAALLAGLAVASLAALAVAKTSKPKVKTAHNASLAETILVDSRGMTLYELKPETANQLLCSSSACIRFWPPLKTTKNEKLVKASDVKGKLGRLHRSGLYQVTLDGHPLYHFSLDKAKGSVKGNGFSFPGGTWHVVKKSASSTGTKTTTTTTSTTSTSTSSTYSYPAPTDPSGGAPGGGVADSVREF